MNTPRWLRILLWLVMACAMLMGVMVTRYDLECRVLPAPQETRRYARIQAELECVRLDRWTGKVHGVRPIWEPIE